jgi:acylphosphatase
VVTPAPDRRLTAWVEGRVQGVGFRWWVRANALELGLAGFAENLTDGRVKVVAEGPEDSCAELLGRLDDRGPGPARRGVAGGRPAGTALRRRPGSVSRVTHRWAQAAGGMSGFTER